MNRYRTLFAAIFWAFFLSFAPKASAQIGEQQRFRDSLRIAIRSMQGEDKLKGYQKLVNTYVVEIRSPGIADTVLVIYDEMEREAIAQGDIGWQGVIMGNRIAHLLDVRQFDEVISQTPAVLDFMEKSEMWTKYYPAALNISEAYRRKGEYDAGIRDAEKRYEFAKNHGHNEGMGVALYAMSRHYSALRRFQEAEKCLRESIELLKYTDSYLNVLASVYHRFIISLVGQGRYEEALLAARENEEVNRRYEEASGSPQPSAWGNLWIAYVDIYRQMEEPDKAWYYAEKVDSLSRGSMKLYKERGHILYMKGRYAEAIEMLNRDIEANPRGQEAEALKLMALIKMGRADDANDLLRRVIAKQDSVRNMEYNAQLDELHTQYEVDKHVAEKERNRNYLFFALIGCILLLLLLGLTFYYNRSITKKNRSLYRQIKERDRLVEERDESTLVVGNAQQCDLVLRLCNYISDNKDILKTDIGRDELTSALATNKNTLSEAVKAVTGKTLMEYIRILQVEEARRMIDRHPELTLESIALDCGFSTPSTFYRIFLKHYGINPSVYRKVGLLESR